MGGGRGYGAVLRVPSGDRAGVRAVHRARVSLVVPPSHAADGRRTGPEHPLAQAVLPVAPGPHGGRSGGCAVLLSTDAGDARGSEHGAHAAADRRVLEAGR